MSDPTPIGVAPSANKDVAKARLRAAQIVTYHGIPESYEEAVDVVAYAYACGSADGYREAADLATESYRNLIVLMSKEADGE